jgi:hypothetical protein
MSTNNSASITFGDDTACVNAATDIKAGNAQAASGTYCFNTSIFPFNFHKNRMRIKIQNAILVLSIPRTILSNK